MRPGIAAVIALALSTVVSGQQPRQHGTRTPTPRTTPAPRTPARPAPAAPAREAEVPLRVGEALTYDVSWSQFITAGTATTRVVEKKPSSGSTAYAVVADGRPAPLVARFYLVFYKMESLLDSFSILSLGPSQYSEERDRKHQSTTRFDRK